MALDVKPGSVIQIEVTRNPASERAAKTLSRIFLRDPANRRLSRRRQRILSDTVDPRRRGGRLWNVRSHSPRLVQPQRGSSCKVRATLDVIDDLRSVERFISVK